MQVRCTQPYAIERQVCITKSLSEMAEAPRITGVKIMLCHCQFFGVRIKPVPVGADFIDRDYITDVLAAEIASIAAVTICAVLRVNFFTLRGQLRIDRTLTFESCIGQPAELDASDLFE